MKLKDAKSLAKRNGIDPARISNLENTSEYMITHGPDACAGEHCCIHHRTDHPMRKFPQHFRWDRAIMERTCPHGVGHPDPDQDDYFEKYFGDEAWVEWVHGCDGCCNPESDMYLINYGSDIIDK